MAPTVGTRPRPPRAAEPPSPRRDERANPPPRTNRSGARWYDRWRGGFSEPPQSLTRARPARPPLEFRGGESWRRGCLGLLGTPPLAPCEGRSVPFHAVSLLRSSHTACRGDAVSDTNHPSRPPRSLRALRGWGTEGAIWEEPAGAREHPMCAEGWAMWAPGRWPDLPKATGGTAQLGKPLAAEPPGRASSWGV